MPYKKKKPVKMKEGPKSYVAEIIEYREKKKKINEKIFVDNEPKKKLNKKKNNKSKK